MFSPIDTRLRQIIGYNRSCSEVSVLIVDLYQLPPVMDTSIYLCPKSCMLSVFSENIFWNKFEFSELTEIMRQKEDKTFITDLNNLAKRIMSEDDIALIRSRETTEEYVPENVIRLDGDNRSVDSFILYYINTILNFYTTLKINLKDGTAYEYKGKDQF